jgi:hypothetical protein
VLQKKNLHMHIIFSNFFYKFLMHCNTFLYFHPRSFDKNVKAKWEKLGVYFACNKSLVKIILILIIVHTTTFFDSYTHKENYQGKIDFFHYHLEEV